jgi:predicted dienelactone hydrolase
MAHVWYPAQPGPKSHPIGGNVAFPEAGVWHPRPPVTLVMRQDPLPATLRQLIQRFNLPGLAYDQVTFLQAHSYPKAPLSPAAAPFPVLVFSHAYWLESATSRTYLMENLASHGCVVASFGHPYESLATVFPDGRRAGLDLANPRLDAERRFAQLEAISREHSPLMEASLQLWAADTHCLLDEIERRNAAGAGEPWSGRLDVNRMGVLGVSFGGSVAGQVCGAEPRCAADINIDGPQLPLGDVAGHRLQQPFMFITSADHQGMNAPIYDRARQAAYQVTLRGAHPVDLTGAALWFPLLAELSDFHAGNVYQFQRNLNACCLAFFDRHLRGRAAPLLDGSSAEDPQVENQVRQPTR